MTNLPRLFNHFLEPDDIFFKNFFDRNSFFSPAVTVKPQYPVDVYETENTLNFEIAVPGLDKEDIQIEELDNVLKISYEKEEISKQSDNERAYIQSGIAKRSFNLGWKISDNYNLKEIDATMDRGILKITVPKKQEKEVIKNTIKIK